MHGPNISNFKEIYEFLKIKNISKVVTSEKNTIKALINLFNRKKFSKKAQKELNKIGVKILDSTINEINFIINKNETKKT